jgi:uncharacterized membrane protein
MLTTFSSRRFPSLAASAIRAAVSKGRTTTMTTLMRALLAVHVLAGTVALLVAPIAMVAAKGGPTHRRWGVVYYWAMATVALSAIALSVWHPSPFLTLVAVFSFYFVFRGRRVLDRKRPDRGERASVLDWTGAVGTAAACAALVVLGVVQPGPVWVRLGVVAVVFGLLGLALAAADVRSFVWPPVDRNTWWFAHMTGMLGSYVAALSAFSVVNFTFLPTTARWLWPTLVGTPLIVLWIAYYKRRFRRGAPAPGMA